MTFYGFLGVRQNFAHFKVLLLESLRLAFVLNRASNNLWYTECSISPEMPFLVFINGPGQFLLIAVKLVHGLVFGFHQLRRLLDIKVTLSFLLKLFLVLKKFFMPHLLVLRIISLPDIYDVLANLLKAPVVQGFLSFNVVEIRVGRFRLWLHNHSLIWCLIIDSGAANLRLHFLIRFWRLNFSLLCNSCHFN